MSAAWWMLFPERICRFGGCARMHTRLARPFSLKGGVSETGTFAGYGSVFGVEDHYSDIVLPGAFTRSLKERGMPKMLWQHDTAVPIGVWTKAKEDATGLYLEGQLALKTQSGAETYELLKMGALDGLSIGFTTKKAEYDEKKGIRKLVDVELYEVSPVTFPANEEARVESVKAMTHSDVAMVAHGIGKLHGTCKSCPMGGHQGDMMKGLDELVSCLGGSGDGKSAKPKDIRFLESILRDAGLSRAEAKAVLADGYSALRDAAAADVEPERDARESGGADDFVADLRRFAASLQS